MISGMILLELQDTHSDGNIAELSYSNNAFGKDDKNRKRLLQLMLNDSRNQIVLKSHSRLQQHVPAWLRVRRDSIDLLVANHELYPRVNVTVVAYFHLSTTRLKVMECKDGGDKSCLDVHNLGNTCLARSDVQTSQRSCRCARQY